MAGYPDEGIDRPRRCVTSHQHRRSKNTKKFSVGGPESGPLLFHSSHVNGTNTSAPSSSRTRQALNAVTGLHKESRNREGKKRNIVAVQDMTQPGISKTRNPKAGLPPSCGELRIAAAIMLNTIGTSNGARIRPVS